MTTAEAIQAIVGVLSLLLMFQQNRLIGQQDKVFAKSVGKVTPPSKARQYWPLLAMFILTTGNVVVAFHSIRTPEEPTVPPTIATDLRLQFGSDGMPRMVSQDNVFRWYALRNVLVEIDKKTDKRTTHALVNVFVVFDRPVSIEQILIDGGGAALPEYEVKDVSPRHAVIAFNSDITGAVVDFKVHD